MPGRSHFPAARSIRRDEDAGLAALRETEEETGLKRSFVEPIGYLDGYITRTSFRIIPVVALVRPGFTLKPARGMKYPPSSRCRCGFLMSAENHARAQSRMERKNALLLRDALWRTLYLGSDRRHDPQSLRPDVCSPP